MREIVVAPHEGKWAAFVNDKPIVKSICKPCILEALTVFYKSNLKFSAIIVKDEAGQITETIQIGASSGR